MPSRSYISPGLVLSLNPVFSQTTQDLQRDLRALGYFAGPVDGVFGNVTRKGVLALQYDLMNNTGTGTDGNAPVVLKSYNNGSVTSLTGAVDQGLAACIGTMLDDDNFPKLPFSPDPANENQKALLDAAQAAASQVPLPFLLQILSQESGQRQFQVPEGANQDNFVTVGLDHNNETSPVPITSHGYGIGQFTLFHHPPRPEEIAGVVSNATLNVGSAISTFRAKFDHYIIGPIDTAEDRIQEHGNAPLRQCRYPSGDALYMKDCSNCCRLAGTFDIVAGVTPVYAGAQTKYDVTQYHKGDYTDVPVRANIPCDWPYAIRRYNGSYDYQAEVLLRIAQQTA